MPIGIEISSTMMLTLYIFTPYSGTTSVRHLKAMLLIYAYRHFKDSVNTLKAKQCHLVPLSYSDSLVLGKIGQFN